MKCPSYDPCWAITQNKETTTQKGTVKALQSKKETESFFSATSWISLNKRLNLRLDLPRKKLILRSVKLSIMVNSFFMADHTATF